MGALAALHGRGLLPSEQVIGLIWGGKASGRFSSQRGGKASGCFSSQRGGKASGCFSSQRGGKASGRFSSQRGGCRVDGSHDPKPRLLPTLSRR